METPHFKNAGLVIIQATTRPLSHLKEVETKNRKKGETLQFTLKHDIGSLITKTITADADCARTRLLGHYGIRVIRYTNQDVLNNLAGVYDDLVRKVQRLIPPTPLFKGGWGDRNHAE